MCQHCQLYTYIHTYIYRLRIRVKALQQVIDTQSTKIASLMTQREMAAIGQQDESTGQGTVYNVHIV